MYAKTLALCFLSLCAVPAVVRAESGLCFSGATLTLLVFYNKIFEADAATHRIRRTLSSFFRRTNGRDGSNGNGSTSERPGESLLLTSDVKQHLKSILTVYVVRTWLDGDGACLVTEVQPHKVPRNSKGQKSIRKALLWRHAAPRSSSVLDGILKEGEKAKFFSVSDSKGAEVVRTPRLEDGLLYLDIQHPYFGDMTLRTVTLPLTEAVDPQKANMFFSRLESFLHLPSPLSKESPLAVQEVYGLLMPLDILKLKGKYLLKEQNVPERVVYNMFFLHTPTECGLEDLIRVVNERKKKSPGSKTAHQAQVSMTVQVLSILDKLRSVHLVPPPVDTGSFVVTPAGNVLMAEYFPMLMENELYVMRPDGVVVRNKQGRQQKKGFTRFSDGDEGYMPYEVDASGPDDDAANLLVDIWCPSAGSDDVGATAAAATKSSQHTTVRDISSSPAPSVLSTSSEEEKPAAEAELVDVSSPAASVLSTSSEDEKPAAEAEPVKASSPVPSAMPSSSQAEGAAERRGIDWSECPRVPEEVIRIYDALTSGAVTLSRVTSLHDFEELVRSVKAPTPPQTD